jgi:hypothetical protein
MPVENFTVTLDLDYIDSDDVKIIQVAAASWPNDSEVAFTGDEAAYLIATYCLAMSRLARTPNDAGVRFAYVTRKNEPKYDAILHALYRQMGWATEHIDPEDDVLCRFTESDGNIYMYFCRGYREPVFFAARAYGLIARI